MIACHCRRTQRDRAVVEDAIQAVREAERLAARRRAPARRSVSFSPCVIGSRSASPCSRPPSSPEQLLDLKETERYRDARWTRASIIHIGPPSGRASFPDDPHNP
jgi:hypothetical protein